MGRWAQSKRRGGGGPPAAVAPAPSAITAVDTDGSNLVQVFFDNPISALNGSAGDTSFNCDGEDYQGTFQISSTQLQFSFSSAKGPGLAWNLLTATPTWLSTGSVVPASGLTT